jgi:hypothetical protein
VVRSLVPLILRRTLDSEWTVIPCQRRSRGHRTVRLQGLRDDSNDRPSASTSEALTCGGVNCTTPASRRRAGVRRAEELLGHGTCQLGILKVWLQPHGL